MGDCAGRYCYLLGYINGRNDPVKSDGFVRVIEDSGRSG